MATLDLGQVVAPDCLSAYEAAVEGGYTGSEESFQLKLSSLLTTDDVVDNLTSTSTTNALSANQGRTLNLALGNRNLETYTSLAQLGLGTNPTAMELTAAIPVGSTLQCWVSTTVMTNVFADFPNASPVELMVSHPTSSLLYLTAKCNPYETQDIFLAWMKTSTGELFSPGWVKLSTSTQPQQYNLSLAADITPHTTGSCSYFKTQDNVVTVSLGANVTSPSSGMTLGTIPTGFRPNVQQTVPLLSYSASASPQRAMASLQVNTNGSLCMFMNAESISDSTEVYANLTYMLS